MQRSIPALPHYGVVSCSSSESSLTRLSVTQLDLGVQESRLMGHPALGAYGLG